MTAASTDAALVLRLKAGERRAFDEAYRAHSGRTLAFLLHLSRRRDVAEDLHQETWVRFARAAASLSDDTRLLPWLLTIARNAYISFQRWSYLDVSRVFRFGATAAPTESFVDTNLAGNMAVDAEGTHAGREALALLQAALAELAPDAREVLLLVGLDELEPEDVAAVLKIKPEAMRQRLSRARKELKEVMTRLESNKGPKPRGAS
jgi:RNA polymerase sigma factor (sigma-70 family)